MWQDSAVAMASVAALGMANVGASSLDNGVVGGGGGGGGDGLHMLVAAIDQLTSEEGAIISVDGEDAQGTGAMVAAAGVAGGAMPIASDTSGGGGLSNGVAEASGAMDVSDEVGNRGGEGEAGWVLTDVLPPASQLSAGLASMGR
jgi:hypothetical protein